MDDERNATHDEADNAELSRLFHHPATVLLVEDNDVMRERFCDALAREGFRVIALEDGLELRDYWALAIGPGSTVPVPDVVVADEQLPGLGGLDACALMRRQPCSPPCVLLLSRFEPQTVRRARELGVADLLAKPVDLDELCEAVALLIC